MVGHAGSTTGIVHADMTLTRSNVKVKVMGLLNFWKLAKPCLLAAMTVSPLAGLSGLVLNYAGLGWWLMTQASINFDSELMCYSYDIIFWGGS